LVDNVFDRINLYPGAALTSSATRPGTSVFYAADYRRERTFWQSAASATFNLISTVPPVSTSVDSIWLDRGHNLWGKTIRVESSSLDGSTIYGAVHLAVPALVGDVYVPGGDPSTGMCVTEEGAVYSLFASMPASPRHSVYCVDNWQPMITGVILGRRYQLDSYPIKLDEDAGGVQYVSRTSDAGWEASDRAYPFATLELALETIGDTEYNTKLRILRRLLVNRREPAAICMNWGTHPERMRLYQSNMKSYAFGTQRVHRKGTFTFRECGPRID
jgi:hypothetical protein